MIERERERERRGLDGVEVVEISRCVREDDARVEVWDVKMRSHCYSTVIQ